MTQGDANRRSTEHADVTLSLYLNMEGRSIFRAGNIQRAERYFLAAQSLQPDYVLTDYHLALVARDSGRRDEAIRALETIARERRSPGLAADALIRLGNMYDEDQRLEDAYA